MCCYTLLFLCIKSTIVLHKMFYYTLLFCCIKSIVDLHKICYYTLFFWCVKYIVVLHKMCCYMPLFSLFCCVKSGRVHGGDIIHMSWLCWIFSLIYWRHHISVVTCIMFTFVLCCSLCVHYFEYVFSFDSITLRFG